MLLAWTKLLNFVRSPSTGEPPDILAVLNFKLYNADTEILKD